MQRNTMPSTVIDVLAYVLACATAVLLTMSVLAVLRKKQRDAIRCERRQALGQLQDRLDSHLALGRFSYRPATRELVLDARAALLNGLAGRGDVQGSSITVSGWSELPAVRQAAGRIEEALTDGLAQGEMVRCEYLARTPGSPDRHILLTAVPVRKHGVLIGAVV